jgi:hypothetical protein
MRNTVQLFCLMILFVAGFGSCKKFVEIESPRNSLETSDLFVDSATASSAVLGIYSKIMGIILGPNFGCGMATVYAGQSADELNYISTGDASFMNNTLVESNGGLESSWKDVYSFIYQANACIEGLEQSTTISQNIKDQFTAEAKLIRAYFYFYLINLFGDVPYITTTDWTKSFGNGRTPVATVYEHIVQDLEFAQTHLPVTYPAAGKIRPVQLTATALMARVQLYLGNWANAEAAATKVISSAVYPKLSALSDIFLKNSDEAIWQLAAIHPSYNAPETHQLIGNGTPVFSLTDGLLNSFETGDQRYGNWTKSFISNSKTYYHAYKYKIRGGTPQNEYYMLLRLGEQYLIRAEARAHLNNVTGATQDLNVIRKRAGLADLPATLTQNESYSAIEKERRIELFCEWGHRWLDLKRTGRADAVLAPLKSKWVSTAVLYPIPLSELKADPSLTQNPGYF